MPATDCQEASSASFSSLGFSILSRRRGQVHSMESSHEATAQQTELESFQKLVAEKFHELEASNSVEFLSIPWTQKLLEVFLCIQEEFRVIVFNNKGFLNKPPMDRHMNDFFERSVKALDVCNAIRDGIEQIRQWQKQLEIVLCALDNQRSIGEGQIRRAKKALIDFTIGLLDEKESNASISHRNRSFGPRKNVEKDHKSFGNFRSLSWSFSRSWSAAKQLQALGNNMVAPRANEVIATNGLNVAVFTMNYVLLFVMWALVAAIPCQDRGLQTNFSVTRQFLWAVPMLSLHERILEESKKRDRKNACGLLKEIHEVEKCAYHMKELIESLRFPFTEEKEGEARRTVKELGMMYEVIKDGLYPLDRQIREVFSRIVRSRTEGLDSIGRANTHIDKI